MARLVPPHTASFCGNGALCRAAILISVGYMDPGTGHRPRGWRAIQVWPAVGGGLASFMAVILQVISARLGVATGKDLAQCCRDWYPNWTRWPN